MQSSISFVFHLIYLGSSYFLVNPGFVQNIYRLRIMLITDLVISYSLAFILMHSSTLATIVTGFCFGYYDPLRPLQAPANLPSSYPSLPEFQRDFCHIFQIRHRGDHWGPQKGSGEGIGPDSRGFLARVG